jgi:hypothetical protein
MIAGCVRLMLTVSVTGALTVPATEVHVPVASWPAPVFDNEMGAVQPAIPEPLTLSVPEKVTVTGVLFQPLAFGGGVAVYEEMGWVKSMLMPLTISVPTSPARLVQVPVAA